jgi:hypothetical protein
MLINYEINSLRNEEPNPVSQFFLCQILLKWEIVFGAIAPVKVFFVENFEKNQQKCRVFGPSSLSYGWLPVFIMPVADIFHWNVLSLCPLHSSSGGHHISSLETFQKTTMHSAQTIFGCSESSNMNITTTTLSFCIDHTWSED